MNFWGKVILNVYGILIGVVIIILIYLIFRRIKAKKLEDFEKRDN